MKGVYNVTIIPTPTSEGRGEGLGIRGVCVVVRDHPYQIPIIVKEGLPRLFRQMLITLMGVFKSVCLPQRHLNILFWFDKKDMNASWTL